MNTKIRLLLVEDNPHDVAVWKDLLETHNAKEEELGGAIFALTVASTLNEARSEIDARSFDAAIVDLRLAADSAADGIDRSGNEVIALLLAREMAAIAAFTGEPGAVEVPEHARLLVRVVTKGADEGEGPHAVLAWLTSQIPMNIAIRSAEAIIKREMAEFFVRSIWPRWNNWLGDGGSSDDDFLATAVARHLTSHVYAALLDKHKQKAHPEEWYMVPAIHSGVRTGDIIRTEQHGLEIVITPRCDLATGKRKTLQLAACVDVSEEWESLMEARSSWQKELTKLDAHSPNREATGKKLEAAINKVRAFTQHRSTSSLHFLPRMKLLDDSNVGPLMINFDQIRSAPVGDVEGIVLAHRIASVSSEFVPSIVERLGSFFSRIGTPDFSDFQR